MIKTQHWKVLSLNGLETRSVTKTINQLTSSCFSEKQGTSAQPEQRKLPISNLKHAAQPGMQNFAQAQQGIFKKSCTFAFAMPCGPARVARQPDIPPPPKVYGHGLNQTKQASCIPYPFHPRL